MADCVSTKRGNNYSVAFKLQVQRAQQVGKLAGSIARADEKRVKTNRTNAVTSFYLFIRQLSL